MVVVKRNVWFFSFSSNPRAIPSSLGLAHYSPSPIYNTYLFTTYPSTVLNGHTCRTVRRTVTEHLTVFGWRERFYETETDPMETGWSRHAIHLMIKMLKDNLRDYGFGDVLLADSQYG